MDPELSMIQALSVEGSVLENGTIPDIDLQRGRFSFGHRTVRDIDL